MFLKLILSVLEHALYVIMSRNIIFIILNDVHIQWVDQESYAAVIIQIKNLT